MTHQSTNVRWQLCIVAIGLFRQTLDTTSVKTATPSMAHDPGASPLHVHTVNVYHVLTVTLMLPVSGWHGIFLITIPIGIAGAIAPLMLMPDYRRQTGRFDFAGFMLLVAGIATLALVVVFPLVAMLSRVWLPLVLLLQGMVNAIRFCSINTLTLKERPDELASGGNSLWSMIMQLSMSTGVTVAVLSWPRLPRRVRRIARRNTRWLFIPAFVCH